MKFPGVAVALLLFGGTATALSTTAVLRGSESVIERQSSASQQKGATTQPQQLAPQALPEASIQAEPLKALLQAPELSPDYVKGASRPRSAMTIMSRIGFGALWIGGVLGTVAIIYKRREIAAAATELVPADMHADHKSSTMYERVFMMDKNLGFGENLELTARCVAILAFFACRFIFPNFPTFGLDLSLFTSWSIVMFVFSIGKTVGETNNNVITGVAGTFLAVLDTWIMFGLFPKGNSTGQPSYVLWAGIANGMIFTLAVLGVQMPINVKVFALSNKMGWWMAFLLGKDEGFSTGFTLSLGGTAVSTFISTFWGASVCYLAILLPFPRFAITKSKSLARQSASTLTGVWKEAIEFYMGTTYAQFKRDALVSSRKETQGSFSGLRSHISNGYWECFGFGSWQTQRKLLSKVEQLLAQGDDYLANICVIIDRANFNEKHAKFVAGAKKNVDDTLGDKESGMIRLLLKITQISCKGGLQDKDEMEELQKLALAQKKMAENLKDASTKQIANVGSNSWDPDFQSEQGIVNLLVNFSNVVCFCADDLVAYFEETKSPPDIDGGNFLVDAVDPGRIFHKKHMNFVSQNFLGIMICFFVGWQGYSLTIKSNNASIATNATILLTTSAGSVLLKSKDRLLGMVVGTVIGQLAYAILAWCTLWAYLAVLFAFVAWTGAALFVYFNSTDYSTIGLLLVAFGTSYFLKGCSNEVYDPKVDGYPNIINTIVTILVMLVVGRIFDAFDDQGRAQDLAYHSVKQIFVYQRQALADLFDEEKKDTRKHEGKLEDMLASAKFVGEQANQEPRSWRCEWPHRVYGSTLQCFTSIRVYLNCMEYAVAEKGVNGAPKMPFLFELAKDSDFVKVKTVVEERMKQVEGFFEIFAFDSHDKNSYEKMCELHDIANSQRNYVKEMEEAIGKFMTKMKAQGAKGSLASNSFEVCLFLEGLSSIMRDMRELQHEILQTARS